MQELKLEEVFESLHSSPQGLSEEEAQRRLKIYGENTVEREKHQLLKFLIRVILNPVNVMILSAALLSFLIGHIHDAYFILFLFILNVFIIFYQEFKSEKYLEELRKKLERHVEVLRDGKWKWIPARYIVPGDIVRLNAGETVPADIKIIEAENLLVDESAITGESLPVEKSVGDVLYAPSIIKRGKCIGIVVATGIHAKYGQLINLVQTTKSKSNLEKTILKIGIFLMILAFTLIITSSIKLFLEGKSIYDILLFDLALLVSAIPTALPAVVSSILLVSSYNLAKRNILVRRLSSVFDIAQMNMLCTDKTGTLTENKIRLDKIVPVNATEEEVLKYAFLASDPSSGDPIDTAIAEKVKEKRIEIKEKVIKFEPYDSVRKYSYAILEGNVVVKKGSPERLLEEIKAPKEYYDILDKLYEEGYRVLAVIKNNELLGFLAFYDPPRKDAPIFIKELKDLGLKIKMLTGDSKKIAIKVAKEVGIEGPAISRKEMYRIATKQHFDFIAERYNIFAEIYPEDKYRIVESLKKRYYIGVTGDGVNDIGAFKVANVGIAVYNAVQAAKEFADLILTAPGLKQLVDAIKEARRGFKRIENYVIYRIAENIRFPFFVTLSLFLYDVKLSPIFMLMLTILNDIPIIAVAFDNVNYSRKPCKFNLRTILIISLILGFIGVLNSLLYLFLIKRYLPLELLEAFLFLKLLLTGHFLLFVVRTREEFWFQNPPKGVLLISTISTQIIGTLIILFLILEYYKANVVYLLLVLFTWIYAFLWMNITDFIKVLIFRKM